MRGVGGGNKLLEGGNYFKHFCLWIFFRAFVFCKVSNYLREAINRGMAVIHGNKLFHLSNPRAWMLKNLNRELRDLVQFLLWWPRYSWLKWNTIFVIYSWFFASCAKTFYTWCSNPQLYIYIFFDSQLEENDKLLKRKQRFGVTVSASPSSDADVSFVSLRRLCHAIFYHFRELKIKCVCTSIEFQNWCYSFVKTIIILDIKTVSCCLLLWMKRMDVDWNLKKLGQVFILRLQKSPKKHKVAALWWNLSDFFFITVHNHFVYE